MKLAHEKSLQIQKDQQHDLVSKAERMREMQTRLHELEDAKERLVNDNVLCSETTEKAVAMRTEAVAAILKLDETRLVLNRLLGP